MDCEKLINPVAGYERLALPSKIYSTKTVRVTEGMRV